MRVNILVFAYSIGFALSAGAHAQLLGPEQPPKDLTTEQQISEYIREVFQDRDDVYWFGTNGDGVCRFDGESLEYLSIEQGFGGIAVRGILQSADGALWFATDSGVSRYLNGEFTNYTMEDGLSDNQTWSIMCDKAGTIWVGTHEGVCRFNGKSFVSFALPRVKVDESESRFSPKVVFAMIEDKSGNIWFGTDGEGVHRFDGKTFTSFTTKEGLAGNVVRAIREDRRGRIWIGTNGGGASCYERGKFRNFTQKDGISNDRIYEIFEDSSGNLWFSTLGAGACRFDGKTFTAFPEDPKLIINGRPARSHIQEFFEDRDGVLWIGCSGGLFRFDGNTFINVTRNGPWPKSVKAGRSDKAADSMSKFEKMMNGEWRVTFAGGQSQFDRWSWGPGKRSALTQTYGTDAEGNPWRELQIIYWHPGQKRIRILSFHPDIVGIGRGIGEGVMEFRGRNARADFDLHQPGNPVHPVRKMGLRWEFEGEDTYQDTLFEDSGSGFQTLASWKFDRSKTLTALPPIAEAAAKPKNILTELESLLGLGWRGRGRWENGESLRVYASVEWIPYVQAFYIRFYSDEAVDAASHMLDAYIFHHVGDNKVRCLALSKSGSVYEGNIVVQGDGSIQVELKGFEGDKVVPYVARLELESDRLNFNCIRKAKGDDRSPMLHVKLEKVGAASD